MGWIGIDMIVPDEDPIPIDGDSETVRRVLDVLASIIDPCSAAVGQGASIVDMGIVRSIELHDDSLLIKLLPTSAMCMFVGIFREEIVARVTESIRLSSVDVVLEDGEEVWTPAMLHGVPSFSAGHRTGAVTLEFIASDEGLPPSRRSAFRVSTEGVAKSAVSRD